MSKQAASVFDDAAEAFVEPAEVALVEVDVPQAVVDRFEADVLLHQGMTDGHAVRLPPDAAIATD